METIRQIFSFICGQGRCFVVDGTALPLCQRCMGLYAGALLTAIWLVAAGTWRRGMPGWSVFLINTATLLTAILGGLRVLDYSPMWRLTCGLWTGHVVVLWLIGGAVQLRSLSRPQTRPQLPWRRRDKLQGLIFPAVLAGFAAACPLLLQIGRCLWTVVAVLGVSVLIFMTVVAAGSLIGYCVWNLIAKPNTIKVNT